MHIWEHKAQYYETDGMGIIHHSNYIRWFEEARVALLDALGCPYEQFEAAGFGSPVLSVSCQYKTPTRFAETVQIATEIVSYTGVKMTIRYEVSDRQSGMIRCTGESSHCFVQGGRPVSLRRAFPEFDHVLQAAAPL